MGGGKSVGSWGSGCSTGLGTAGLGTTGLGTTGLGTTGFLVVVGRLVGFLGRDLWVNTAPIRRNRANAEKSPTPAFIVLQKSRGSNL